MVALNAYNPAEHDSFQEGFGIIEEPGPHQVQIIEDNEETTKDGHAVMSALTLEITEGEYKGRKIWERVMVEHDDHATDKTKKGVRMGLQKLRDFCDAIGHTDLLENTEQLMYRPFLAMIEVEKGNAQYPKDKNKLGKLFPLGGAQPPADKPAVHATAVRVASGATTGAPRPAAAAGASAPAGRTSLGKPAHPWTRPGAGAGAPKGDAIPF